MAIEKGDPIPGLIYEAKLVHDHDDDRNLEMSPAVPSPPTHEEPIHVVDISPNPLTQPLQDPKPEVAPVGATRSADEVPSQVVEDGEEEEDDAVKLGLGDFIFYSLLVSKAALFGFTTFATCYIVVLFGLITTMMLLALFAKPLPALPVSMLLGVALYFFSRATVVPLINEMGVNGYYF